MESLTVDPETKVVYVKLKNQNGYSYQFTIGDVRTFERQLEKAQSELGIGVVDGIPVFYRQPGWFSKS